jgi:hypothetical protein
MVKTLTLYLPPRRGSERRRIPETGDSQLKSAKPNAKHGVVREIVRSSRTASFHFFLS